MNGFQPRRTRAPRVCKSVAGSALKKVPFWPDRTKDGLWLFEDAAPHLPTATIKPDGRTSKAKEMEMARTSVLRALVAILLLFGGDAFQSAGAGTPESAPTLSSPNTCYNFSDSSAPPSTAANASDDEFVGPFASWADLKRDYGAVGDGVHDDTKPIQAALDALSTLGKSPILYIPAGTYLVTQTVTVMAANGVSVIGENPNTTSLKWGGPKEGILFHIDGVAYSRFDRLTFDGAGAAGVLVDQSVKDLTQGRLFDTGNQYADDVFENAGIGIQGGQYGAGAAESYVLRCKFSNNTSAGIILKNFNALDWFIWHSQFEHNKYGITNNPGAGNFHVFNSVFDGSMVADLDIVNTGNFNFRDNFSINSAMFLDEEYYYTNAAVTRLQGNTVITPSSDNNCHGCSIYQGNMGPTVMTDNVFVSPPDATWAAVTIMALNPPDCVSVGNAFTIKNGVQCGSYGNGDGRLIALDDRVVSASSINHTAPALPGAPPGYDRKVFEVRAGSPSMVIQQAIQQAAAHCGQRPIVHFPYGSYSLSQSIVIPPNCDIQLVGDGNRTRLNWVGLGGGPVLVLQGPSRAILRDFFVYAGKSETGIEVQNADQPGSRIYMQQPQMLRSLSANLLVDGLDHTNVELHNFNLAFSAVEPARTGVALKVVGGPLAAQGNPQHGRTNLLAGSLGANHISYQASRGANLLVRDAWYEGNNASTYAQISDNSSVTLEGSRIAVLTSGNSVEVDNLSCNAILLSSAPDAPIKITGGGNGALWSLGNNYSQATRYLTDSVAATRGPYNLNRRFDAKDGSVPIADMTAIPDGAFIGAMLAQSRTAHPSNIVNLPEGVTDARFYRVSVELGTIGVYLKR